MSSLLKLLKGSGKSGDELAKALNLKKGEKSLYGGKIEVLEHPPDIIDVDPEILANMRRRLAENPVKSGALAGAGGIGALEALDSKTDKKKRK